MLNPRTLNTEILLAEERRLIALIDRLRGFHFMKGERGRAQKTLATVQRELNQREGVA